MCPAPYNTRPECPFIKARHFDILSFLFFSSLFSYTRTKAWSDIRRSLLTGTTHIFLHSLIYLQNTGKLKIPSIFKFSNASSFLKKQVHIPTFQHRFLLICIVFRKLFYCIYPAYAKYKKVSLCHPGYFLYMELLNSFAFYGYMQCSELFHFHYTIKIKTYMRKINQVFFKTFPHICSTPLHLVSYGHLTLPLQTMLISMRNLLNISPHLHIPLIPNVLHPPDPAQ